MLGCLDAWRLARAEAREYLRYVRWREGRAGQRDLRLAQAFRAMGFPGRPVPVDPSPRTEAFRELARAIWPDGQGALAPGCVEIPVGGASGARVQRAVVRAVSRWLRAFERLNQAILDGRLWERRDSRVMVHLRVRGDLQSAVVDAADLSDRGLLRSLARARRKMEAVWEHPLRPLGVELLLRWARDGRPLWSPAGAMVSLVGTAGVPEGQAPLALRLNGVPLTVTVGEVRGGRVRIWANPDHRAFDGEDVGSLYGFLREEVQACLSA